MANGKPGDHPFTDIISHGGSEFGDPVDALVKEMHATPGFAAVREEVARILLESSPAYRPPAERDGLVQAALDRLLAVQSRLRR